MHTELTMDELRTGFRAPSPDARPMMRWWWFGPSVERVELDRELTAMAAAGIGGVEVAFVYPLAPVDTLFGSEEFLGQVRFAAEQARELGLRFDLTLGSGWSYGGGHIGPDLAARQLHWDRREIGGPGSEIPVGSSWPGDELVAAFIGGGSLKEPRKYTELSIVDGVIRVPEGSGPQEVLLAYSRLTGQNVKRAAAGAEGPVLDHYSAAAAAEHIRQVAAPLLEAATPGLVGSVFCDSLEVYGSDWTNDALAEFAKRRNYDLRPRLYQLIVDSEGSDQLRADFYRTLSELYEENFVAVFQRWASEQVVPFRIQSYGEPPATVSSYRFADLYEGEGWGWKRMPQARWASSAAHLYGKNVVSAEAWTWVHSPSFRATPLDLKGEAHEHFLSGVNHLIGHGWPYSPVDSPGLGWFFYAAGALDDRNPWWPAAPSLNAYLQRLCWLLRQGIPVADVKVYVPATDIYASMGRSIDSTLNLWAETERHIGPDIPRIIRESGLDFDLFDDDAVPMLSPDSARVVVLPNATKVPPETQAWLDNVAAAGGSVIAVDGSAGDFAAALQQAVKADVVLTPATDTVGAVHRRVGDADIYFVANTGDQTKAFSLALSSTTRRYEEWDAGTGEVRRSGRVAGGIELTLHPYQATVFVTSEASAPEFGGRPERPGSSRALEGPWRVWFADQAAEVISLPHRWEDQPGRVHYSGSATYEVEFDVDVDVDPGSSRVLLDFGDCRSDPGPCIPAHSYRAKVTPPIGVIAEVVVNEVPCGVLWAPPYKIDITEPVRPGTNTLRVIVHNTAANALAADTSVQEMVDRATQQYGQRFQMQMLDRAMDTVSSGLLAVPNLIITDE